MEENAQLLMQLSHFFGTNLATKLGLRQPYDLVAKVQLDEKPSEIYLGAILTTGAATPFNYEEVISTHHIGAVVRILTHDELNTTLIYGSQAPTREQIAALGCTTFDVAIPDFSYEWKPEFKQPLEKLFHYFKQLIIIQQQNKNLLFHCKAGVNRSFKATVMYIVYLVYLRRHQPINELQLRQHVIDTCMHVKARRPAVDFGHNHKNQQINFILTAFKEAYPGTITQSTDHQTRLAVILKLEQYIDIRSSRWGTNIFRNTSISNQKINAARKCILSIANENDIESSLDTLEVTVNCIKEDGCLLKEVIPEIRKNLQLTAVPTRPHFR